MEIADLRAEAEASFRNGDFPAADRAVAQGLDIDPENVDLILFKAKTCAQTGQHHQVGGLVAQALRAGLKVQHVNDLASLLTAHPPDLESGRQIVEALAVADLPDFAKHDLLKPILEATHPDIQDALLEHVARTTALHRYEWRYANRLVEQSKCSAALAVLENACAQGRSSPLSATTLAELLSLEGRHDEAIDVLQAEAAHSVDKSDATRKLLKFLQRADRFSEAGAVMQSALNTWPTDWMLLMRLNRLPLEPHHRQACAARVADTASDEPRYQFHQAITALFDGNTGPILALETESFPGALAQIAGQVRDVIASRPRDFWDRQRIKDDGTQDVQIVGAPGSRNVIIVPTGITFGMLPIRILDAILAEHDCSVIYLKDFNKRVYLRGVRGLAPSFEGTLRAIDDICKDLGATRRIFMGCSSGGFAAHRMAALSGAHAGISFAGPVDLESYFAGTRPAVWNEEFLIQQILARETDLECSNLPILRRATGTRLIHFYGRDWPRDVAQAALLEDVKDVEVVDVARSDHLVVNKCIANGRFDALVRELTTHAEDGA